MTGTRAATAADVAHIERIVEVARHRQAGFERVFFVRDLPLGGSPGSN